MTRKIAATFALFGLGTTVQPAAVSGYEYRGAPNLIYSHIRRFLEELSSR